MKFLIKKIPSLKRKSVHWKYASRVLKSVKLWQQKFPLNRLPRLSNPEIKAQKYTQNILHAPVIFFSLSLTRGDYARTPDNVYLSMVILQLLVLKKRNSIASTSPIFLNKLIETPIIALSAIINFKCGNIYHTPVCRLPESHDSICVFLSRLLGTSFSSKPTVSL